MKTVLAALVLVLAFTTGFTCSKNTPPPATEEVPTSMTPPTEIPAADPGAVTPEAPAPESTPAPAK